MTASQASSSKSSPLTAFVSFPSPYTQTLIVKALVSCLSSVSISLLPPDETDPPQLQWADYDLISFDKPHASPSTHLISSYIYRKALIRKHQLHLTITEYLAKCKTRGLKSVLENGGVPKGWVVDLQFADELDELLMDDLFELAEGMQRNEGKSDAEKSWYILKPGFADRAQGIRMFSTEDELRAIFESFEPPSSDEEDEDDQNDEEEAEAEETAHDNRDEDVDAFERRIAEETARMSIKEEKGDDGTAVMTSQLRHFVIQEYMPRPLLFDITQQPGQTLPDPQGHKFHLRAYVLLTGAYTLHLSRTLLALFSSDPYTHPTADGTWDEDALRPHLTNTCLQTDALGETKPVEELVKLFWELEGLSALSCGAEGYVDRGNVSKDWLDGTFDKAGEVISESVKAGVECGSFGLQLIPNAFEIFGVDLLISLPDDNATTLPLPTVTLLEFNACPDFLQTGDRLKPLLADMFKGVVNVAIAPFFGLSPRGSDDEEQEDSAPNRARTTEGIEKGSGEILSWKLIGEGKVRGPS